MVIFIMIWSLTLLGKLNYELKIFYLAQIPRVGGCHIRPLKKRTAGWHLFPGASGVSPKTSYSCRLSGIHTFSSVLKLFLSTKKKKKKYVICPRLAGKDPWSRGVRKYKLERHFHVFVVFWAERFSTFRFLRLAIRGHHIPFQVLPFSK